MKREHELMEKRREEDKKAKLRPPLMIKPASEITSRITVKPSQSPTPAVLPSAKAPSAAAITPKKKTATELEKEWKEKLRQFFREQRDHQIQELKRQYEGHKEKRKAEGMNLNQGWAQRIEMLEEEMREMAGFAGRGLKTKEQIAKHKELGEEVRKLKTQWDQERRRRTGKHRG
jgi:hypothetical protein